MGQARKIKAADDAYTTIGKAFGLLDEGPMDHEGLTVRQAEFVRLYVGEAGGVARIAAEKAGYAHSAKLCNVIMNKPNVRQAIAARFAARLASLDGDALRCALARLARSDMSNFVTIDNKGKPTLDFVKAQDAAALGQLKELNIVGDNITIKLHDPRPAIELLAKIAGMLVDRQDVTSGGKPIEPPTQVVFDNDRFAELYRQRTGGNRVSPGDDPPNGN